MKTYLIINEQHTLFDEQRNLLRKFGTVEFINVSAEGLTKAQMNEFVSANGISVGDTVIFASPIPYLLKLLSSKLYCFESRDVSVPGVDLAYDVLVFHNDKRDKKELPNGKIIQTISADGWEIA